MSKWYGIHDFIHHDENNKYLKCNYVVIFQYYLLHRTERRLNVNFLNSLLCLVSELMELFLSTFSLVCIIAFVHLCLDTTLGLIVAFRRYCTASTYITDLPNRWKHVRRRIKPYERPVDCTDDSDSEHTDIDAAVDEYKTQLYVSTVMTWNGSEILHRRQ